MKHKHIGFATLLALLLGVGCNSFYKGIHLEVDPQRGHIRLVEPGYAIDSLTVDYVGIGQYQLRLQDTLAARSEIYLERPYDGYASTGSVPDFPNATLWGLRVLASNRATGDLCIFSVNLAPGAKPIVVQEEGRPISRD